MSAAVEIRAVLDARAALLAFAVVVAGPFVAPSLAGTALVAATAMALLAASRPLPGAVRGPVLALCPAFVLIVLIQGLLAPSASVTLLAHHTIHSGWLRGALRDLDIATILAAAIALTSALAPTRLGRGLAWWLRPLELLRVPVEELAVLLALALGIVPRLTADLESLRLAQRARGIDTSSMRTRARLRLMSTLLTPLVVGAFRQSRITAETMHARGYTRGGHRTSVVEQRVGPADVILLAVVVAVVVVAVVVGGA